MQPLITTNILAIVLLSVLVISASLNYLRSFFFAYGKRKHFVIYEVPYDAVKNLKSILGLVHPPFTFEVAVSQLGKEKSYYLTLPSHRAGKLKGLSGARKIDDYDVYYPGGTVVGGYGVSEKTIDKLDIDKIDFSGVNEIGEGAVVQFVVKKKGGGKLTVNIRALVSAPSSFQAKEIFAGMKDSLKGVQLREVKSAEFINMVNAREFSDKEAATLAI